MIAAPNPARRSRLPLVVAAILVMTTKVLAQEVEPPVDEQAPVPAPPTLLALDKSVIAAEQPPIFFAPGDINADIAAVGLRDPLAYFANHVGDHVTLPGGTSGNAGWFALKATPASWVSVPGVDDAVRNFLLAGPGLGSPDAGGDPESLLDSVQGVTPLHEAGLQMLIGRQVCGVVYANEIEWSFGAAGTTLRGPNLGLAAFNVVGITSTSAETLPSVEVEILDANQTCAGELTLLTGAPDPDAELGAPAP